MTEQVLGVCNEAMGTIKEDLLLQKLFYRKCDHHQGLSGGPFCGTVLFLHRTWCPLQWFQGVLLVENVLVVTKDIWKVISLVLTTFRRFLVAACCRLVPV